MSDELTYHSERLPDCDCRDCAIHERNQLRAQVARMEARAAKAYAIAQDGLAECERLRALIAPCREIAMEWTARARIPECGKFGEIAQDLDAAMNTAKVANAAAVTNCRQSLTNADGSEQ